MRKLLLGLGLPPPFTPERTHPKEHAEKNPMPDNWILRVRFRKGAGASPAPTGLLFGEFALNRFQ